MSETILQRSSRHLASASGGRTSPQGSTHAGASSLTTLESVSDSAWQGLCECASEPNIFYTPGWARAFDAHAPSRKRARALTAHDENGRMIGLLPVVTAWDALRLPLPILVAWHAFAPLTSALLDSHCADEAAARLLDAAEATGARALLLPFLPVDGPAGLALRAAAEARGRRCYILDPHERAQLNASGNPRDVLAGGLSSRRLKELRRQRNRLAEIAAITYSAAATPADVRAALDTFLALEARGWKGRRGTALAVERDTDAFIRQAAASLSARGELQIVTLRAGEATIASGIVLRHQNRAFFFKIAYDEDFAKFSPGVLLALDLTDQLCREVGITSADSMAVRDHPMIDRVWVDRLSLGDLLIPLRDGDPALPALRATLVGRVILRHVVRGVIHWLRKTKRNS